MYAVYIDTHSPYRGPSRALGWGPRAPSLVVVVAVVVVSMV